MTKDNNIPKFTPGPWGTLHEGISDLSVEPGIASWSKHDIMGRTEDEIEDRWRIIQANAALIKQSPAMYAELDGTANFLRALADVLEETMKHDSRKEYAAAVLRVAVSMRKRADRIDALLAEARGEA